jgi:hypothetical protein
VRQWLFIFFLILSLLPKDVGFLPCLAADSFSEHSDEDLPECCRNGMCPKFAHGHFPNDGHADCAGTVSTEHSGVLFVAKMPALLSTKSLTFPERTITRTASVWTTPLPVHLLPSPPTPPPRGAEIIAT